VTSDAPIQKKSIRFRARSFVAFSLAPEAPLEEWLERLDRWTANSRGFFTGRPVVLDLNTLKPDVSDIKGLISKMTDRGIRIYAIESNDIGELGLDLPPLLASAKAATLFERPAPAKGKAKLAPPRKREEPPSPNSLMIRSPVRSGQSIIQPNGDVIILGSVGSGSEIIAGGCVHIYGTLRGRVFAGASGNREARIFCQKNEAELLAVDGSYRTADDMEPTSRGRSIQAFLENGEIQVATLN
jgi:septum site-determining protein MinC